MGRGAPSSPINEKPSSLSSRARPPPHFRTLHHPSPIIDSDNDLENGQTGSDKREAHSPPRQPYSLGHSGWTSLSRVLKRTLWGVLRSGKQSPSALFLLRKTRHF